MAETDQTWKKSPDNLLLSPHEVHVWRAELDLPMHEVERFEAVLVPEELARARRFYFEKDRCHWTVARAVLRLLLGRYLDADPRELCFTTNEYGKPAITSPTAGTRLHFNLSHSGNLALYACAYDREVGVDVEYMKSGIDYNELATHFFSAYECASLDALPAVLKEEAFFLCWSRKEAYIKARGKGLSLPLNQFDVSLGPNEPARLLADRADLQASEAWSLHALTPGDRYAGALVVENPNRAVACWQWP